MCVFSSHPFWTSSSLDVPAGVTQEEGHTGFLIHLPSAVRALIFLARRIQLLVKCKRIFLYKMQYCNTVCGLDLKPSLYKRADGTINTVQNYKKPISIIY